MPIDLHIEMAGLAVEVSPERRPPLNVPPPPRSNSISRAAGIGTVLVATGYRPDYPWLRLPIIEPDGAFGSTEASHPRPVSMSSASAFSIGATRGSSTVRGMMLGPSSSTCCAVERPCALEALDEETAA